MNSNFDNRIGTDNLTDFDKLPPVAKNDAGPALNRTACLV